MKVSPFLEELHNHTHSVIYSWCMWNCECCAESILSPVLVPQLVPAVVAVCVVLVSVVIFLLRGSSGEKKQQQPVTLQDPMVKYSLPLVEKQVNCKQLVLRQAVTQTHFNNIIIIMIKYKWSHLNLKNSQTTVSGTQLIHTRIFFHVSVCK